MFVAVVLLILPKSQDNRSCSWGLAPAHRRRSRESHDKAGGSSESNVYCVTAKILYRTKISVVGGNSAVVAQQSVQKTCLEEKKGKDEDNKDENNIVEMEELDAVLV